MLKRFAAVTILAFAALPAFASDVAEVKAEQVQSNAAGEVKASYSPAARRAAAAAELAANGPVRASTSPASRRAAATAELDASGPLSASKSTSPASLRARAEKERSDKYTEKLAHKAGAQNSAAKTN